MAEYQNQEERSRAVNSEYLVSGKSKTYSSKYKISQP